MRRPLVSLALAVCCLAAPVRAQDENESEETCSWERAEAASIEQITANVRDWQGKCVRLKALHSDSRYITANRLLAERLATLESREPHERSIVLHPGGDLQHDRHRPRWEEVLGTVGSCEIAYEHLAAMQAAEPDSFIMLSGLCHYTLDHYLFPVAVRDVEGPVPGRLRRSELRPEQIELQALPPDHPVYALRRETGERMFAALEVNDFEAFLGLTEPRVAQDRADHGENGLGEADHERLADARTDLEAAMAAYRASGIGHGREVMLYQRWLDDDDDDRVTVLEGPDPESAAFWCRLRSGADESDLPVRADDIDNDPSRPYFCVHATDYAIFRAGIVPAASVPRFAYGFAEHPNEEPQAP